MPLVLTPPPLSSEPVSDLNTHHGGFTSGEFLENFVPGSLLFCYSRLKIHFID